MSRERTSDNRWTGGAQSDDRALTEALAICASSGRLSDAQVRGMRAARQRRVVAASAMVAMALVGGGRWRDLRRDGGVVQVAHLETRRGERRAVRLADGSTVRMDGATRLDVRLEAAQRRILLSRGEAFFDIAHDPARPFEVVAGRSSTRVLGTAFDIDLAADGVKLAVYRGRVRFGAAATEDGVTVPAGWRSQFRGGVAASPRRFDRDQPDWRGGWLDTDAMRLGDLVDKLNRGSGPLIAISQPALADLPLSGRFKLDTPRQLLEAMGEAYGFTVRQQGNTLHLQPKASS